MVRDFLYYIFKYSSYVRAIECKLLLDNRARSANRRTRMRETIEHRTPLHVASRAFTSEHVFRSAAFGQIRVGTHVSFSSRSLYRDEIWLARPACTQTPCYIERSVSVPAFQTVVGGGLQTCPNKETRVYALDQQAKL